MENHIEARYDAEINSQIERHRGEYEIIMENNPNNETFLKKIEIACDNGIEFVIPEVHRRDVDFFIFISSCVNLLKDKRQAERDVETEKWIAKNEKKMEEIHRNIDERIRKTEENKNPKYPKIYFVFKAVTLVILIFIFFYMTYKILTEEVTAMTIFYSNVMIQTVDMIIKQYIEK